MRKRKITELNRLTPDEYRLSRKTPLVVVLDNIRSLNNVGAVFRTADAFRIEAIYLCGITATPPHPDIHKTALGAEDTVPWHYFSDTADAVGELRKQGFRLFAVEQAEGSLQLDRLPPMMADGRYALILGHEVKGVQQSVIDCCDGCIEIPQYGVKHSLNVAVAAGVVMWEFFRGLSQLPALDQ